MVSGEESTQNADRALEKIDLITIRLEAHFFGDEFTSLGEFFIEAHYHHNVK